MFGVATARRHLDVHDRHVGPVGERFAQGVVGIALLGHDVKPGLAEEQVVLADHHAHAVGHEATRRCVIVRGMALPRQLPPGDSGSGHGPFGEKAFKGALIGCVVLLIIGAAMVLVGGDAPGAVGTAFIVLGVLGLVTGGVGLLAERLLGRQPPPPASVRGGNGHGPHPPRPERVERIRDRR
jgi:hypothetical protein